MKKNLPVVLLQKIEPLLKKYGQYCKRVNADEIGFYLIDAEAGSPFFFRCQYQAKDDTYYLERQPRSVDNNLKSFDYVKLDAVVLQLEEWLQILDFYATTPSFFDDPILKRYEEEFYDELRLDDPDADQAPLDLAKQLYLEKYLETVIEKVEPYKTIGPEDKKQLAIEIEKEALILKDKVTELTKNQVAEQLSKIWAKARKHGLPFLKEILRDFFKDEIKSLLNKGIEGGVSMLGHIADLLN
ncbi:hypothetical protein [Larkinella soli]|uniref:hypothetical protein n=1 Tax=Larkinella soli TaxID=1770527 RepID=UPI000FFC9538|nr:hypothetical protein [Larkinella soli]